jgi:hypothetical protein
MQEPSGQLYIWGAIVAAIVIDFILTVGLQRYFDRRGVPPDTKERVKYARRLFSLWLDRLKNEWGSERATPLRKSAPLAGGVILVAISLRFLPASGLGSLLHWGVLLSGVFLFVTALPEDGIEVQIGEQAVGYAIRKWQMLCLALSPLLAMVASLSAGFNWHMNRPVLAVAAWLGGIALAVIGGWELGTTRRIGSEFTRALLVASGLTLVALIIRAIDTAHIPLILTGDEGSSGLSAVEFLNGHTDNIFRVGWFSFPSLFFFIQSLPIALLGQTTPALRLLSALGGALTVGAVYLVARELFGEYAALASAIFLLAYHFHNHFSRIGLNNIWDGLWFVLVLGALWVGWQKEQRAPFVIAGLTLGFSQYFYASARLLLALIPVWILLVGWLDRQRLKRLLPDLLVMGFVALTITLPLGRFYLDHPNDFLAPYARVSIFGEWMAHEIEVSGRPEWHILLSQVGIGLRGYLTEPVAFVYNPGTPLLRLPTAIFFCLGAGMLLRKIRDSRTLLLGLWILLFGVSVAFSVPTLGYAQRYVGVMPALAMVIGYSLKGVVARLDAIWPKKAYWIGVMGVVLLILIGADELRFYYLEYTPDGCFGERNGWVAQRLADTLQGKDASWEVLFFGSPEMRYASIPSLPYLAPHIHGLDMAAPWGSPANPQPESNHLIFVFLPIRQDDLRRVQTLYPGGLLQTEKDCLKNTLFWLYEVQLSSSQ